MKTNILSNIISLQQNFATRFVAIVVALMAIGVGNVWGTTVTKTMNQIVTANGYSVSSGSTINDIVTSFALDANITVSTTGDANCGSFWGSSTIDWRLYQNKGGDVTVTAAPGYELESVTYKFSTGNSGTLNTSGNGKNIAAAYQKSSETAISISGSSYTLYVGNTGNNTNGQIKITEISVTYSATASCASNPTVTAASNNGSITSTSIPVRCASGISNIGGDGCSLTSYGFVWAPSATTTTPTLSNNSYEVGTSIAASTAFNYSITGLTPNTEYVIRPYATNGNGTGYGDAYTVTTLQRYTISYNNNGGSGSMASSTKDHGVAFALPANAGTMTKTGYHINQWRLNSAGGTAYALSGSYTANANATFYVDWEANTYQVAFNNNGGSGSMSNETGFTYGVSKALTTCTFTAPTDKYFLGWNTDKDATTALYTDGESVSNLTTTHEGTVTLYAIWKDYNFTNYRTSCCTPWDDPTISYGSYSLSAGGAHTNVTITGTQYGTLSFASSNISVLTVNASTGEVTPVGAGTAHVIATWVSDGTHCEKELNSDDISVSGNVTVTFNKNGGVGTDNQTQSIPISTSTALTTVSALGLTAPNSCKYFYGWADSQAKADAGTRDYTDGESVTLAAGKTLYAIWKTYSYTVTKGTNTGAGTFTLSPASSVDCGGTITITCAADASHKGNPTITATADTYDEINVLSATSAEITGVTGNITVNISYTAKENYAITWMVNGAALSGAAISSCTNEVLEGGSIAALPSDPADNTIYSGTCGANKFMGWSKQNADIITPINDADDIAALGLFKTTGAAPAITENTSFYAVFATSTEANWEMGTIDQLTSGSGYATYNGVHTVTGSDGNSYTYTSYQVMNSSGNQFQASNGKVYNTVALSGITKIVLDGSNNYTNQIKVYEADESISEKGTLVALTGTMTDLYGYDYEYTLSGKEFFLVAQEGTNAPKVNVKVYFGETSNYLTKCCTPVGDVHQGVKDATLAYNGLTLEWDDVAAISSWAVTGVNDDTDAPVAAVNIGTPSDEGSTYECVITGLNQYTNYTFTITGTPAGSNCEKIVTVSPKTPCVAPSSLSIASTNDKWDFCAGETMTLTVSGSNISGSATYQWKKHNGSTWDDIDGATSASYSTTMGAAKAGQYCCTVTNPGSSCDATTSGVWVRVWQLHLGDDDIDFTNTGTGTGSNSEVYLNADTHYEFKLKNNNGGWFGLNSKTVTATESNITLNITGANVNVTSGLEGNYTFAIDYTNKDNPKVSITYPTGNQPSGRKIWFDKSVITGWTEAGTSDLVWRIGKKANSMTNKDDPANAFTLVPGTDRFYVYETKEYNGFEAWHVANNVAWSGNSDNYPDYDNHGIYTHYHNDATNVTRATVYQKYVIGTDGVTLVPTTKKNTDWYCDFWNVTKYDGMLTHTATITPPTNGTITIANAAQSLEATTTTSDLPHRTILTVTATPAPGYQLSSLTVNGEAFTSGNEHILSADATIAATFTAKTITITWNENGGNTPSPTESSYTYNGSTVSLATVTHATKLFAGWFTDPSAGTQITEIGTTNKPTADVTYYAHWVDGNTVQFHAGVGSVTPDKLTQTTYGGAVAAFPTPTIDCEGWSFAGWKEGSAQTETTTNPEASLYAGGHTGYVPATATVHMYAVWKKTTGGVSTQYTAESTTMTAKNTSQVLETGKSINYVMSDANTFSQPLRVYKGNTLTISSSGGATMSKIEFTMNGSYSASDIPLTDSPTQPGSYSDGTWTGSATSVIFKAGAQVRIDKIKVTYTALSPVVTTWTSTPAGCVPMNQVKTPVISPDTEAQTGDVSVTITCATADATIRYTTDGTNPTSSSGTVYSGAFTVSCSATVKAIAYKAEMDDSEIASQAYTITVPTPTFSLPAGTYYDANQSVTLSLPTAHTGTVIKYTTNGDDPSSSSTTYSSAITVTEGTTTIKAIGYNSSCSASSAVASATYIVRFGTAYTLVTDVDDLNAGDQIVMVSADATTSTHHAISTTINSNKRTATTDFNLNAGLTTAMIYPALGAAATVQTFTLGGAPGAWTFHETTNNGYLNCPSAGKLTNTATVSNSNKWTIAIASNIATIHNNEVDATIKSNTSAGHVFAAYAPATDNVQLVKLYSIPNPDPVIKIDADLSAFSACRGSASEYQSFYISGKNLDGSIVLSNVAPLAGYEFCLTSGGTYTATLELTPVSKTVAKTQVFVRLAAGATAGTKNGNLNAAVSANSLSTNIAVTGSVSTADTYTDQIHNTVVTNQCGEYLAPSCPDASAPADESCVETHFKFMGWITEADKNASGVKDDAWYIAHLVTAGTAMTADGTNYYAVWAKEED